MSATTNDGASVASSLPCAARVVILRRKSVSLTIASLRGLPHNKRAISQQTIAREHRVVDDDFVTHKWLASRVRRADLRGGRGVEVSQAQASLSRQRDRHISEQHRIQWQIGAE